MVSEENGMKQKPRAVTFYVYLGRETNLLESYNCWVEVCVLPAPFMTELGLQPSPNQIQC